MLNSENVFVAILEISGQKQMLIDPVICPKM
jgi:hypothetical protein